MTGFLLPGSILYLIKTYSDINKEPPSKDGGVRWEGLEPSRLATHGPQPCLSANSSTSAGRSYYNRLHKTVKQSSNFNGINSVEVKN